MAESTETSDLQTIVCVGTYPWWSVLLWGICAIVIGILFLVTPVITTLVMITMIGAWWFVGGIFSLLSLTVDRSHLALKIITAVLSLLAGLVILCYPLYSTLLILPFFVMLIAVWGIVIGGSQLYHGYVVKDWGSAALGFLSIIFGILLLVYPLEAALSLPFVAGLFALIGGFSAIMGSINLRKVQTT
jgi:uncharacterized membrane protein HdeD (DUF308 family)